MAAFFQISVLLLALTSTALSVEYEGHNYNHYAPSLLKVAHAPIAVKAVEVEHYAPPHYEFKYGVKDEHTGDIKEQSEKREGDRVEGYYSLVEPDGTTRTVHYSSDKHTGFQAQVHKSGHAVHPAPAPVLKKVVVPAVKKVVAPVVTYSHAAPVYTHAAPTYSHAAPVYSHAAPAYSHAAPVYSHAAPAYSHAAPVYSHAAPVYSHAAPVYSHSAPVYSHATYH